MRRVPADLLRRFATMAGAAELVEGWMALPPKQRAAIKNLIVEMARPAESGDGSPSEASASALSTDEQINFPTSAAERLEAVASWNFPDDAVLINNGSREKSPTYGDLRALLSQLRQRGSVGREEIEHALQSLYYAGLRVGQRTSQNPADDDIDRALPACLAAILPAIEREGLADIINKQCDDMATGTQMREFLLSDDGSEPFLREMLRLNLEQFAQRLAALVTTPAGGEGERADLREGGEYFVRMTLCSLHKPGRGALFKVPSRDFEGPRIIFLTDEEIRCRVSTAPTSPLGEGRTSDASHIWSDEVHETPSEAEASVLAFWKKEPRSSAAAKSRLAGFKSVPVKVRVEVFSPDLAQPMGLTDGSDSDRVTADAEPSTGRRDTKNPTPESRG